MRAALVVTTYKRPDALRRVLASVGNQTRRPDQLIVADDGSEHDDQASAISSLRGIPGSHYLWQRDDGFRAARLRNLALYHAETEYVVYIDGDMELHPRFMEDHLRFAREGCFVQGTRARLPEGYTGRLLARPSEEVRTRHISMSRRKYAVRAPAIARMLARPLRDPTRIHGCSQGFWAEDLRAVNGWDECHHGYGGEDWDLCTRLCMDGRRQVRMRFAGIAYHLWHPEHQNWQEGGPWGVREIRSPQAEDGLGLITRVASSSVRSSRIGSCRVVHYDA